MNPKEALELIQLFEKSNLEILEFEQGESRLYLKKMTASPHSEQAIGSTDGLPAPQPNQPKTTQAAEAETHKICSPMVGTFYRSSSPEAEPFVQVGDTVKSGDVLCIIEAMKMLNEIRADVNGVIRQIPVANGEMVDYGKVLFLVEETYD